MAFPPEYIDKFNEADPPPNMDYEKILGKWIDIGEKKINNLKLLPTNNKFKPTVKLISKIQDKLGKGG